MEVGIGYAFEGGPLVIALTAETFAEVQQFGRWQTIIDATGHAADCRIAETDGETPGIRWAECTLKIAIAKKPGGPGDAGDLCELTPAPGETP